MAKNLDDDALSPRCRNHRAGERAQAMRSARLPGALHAAAVAPRTAPVSEGRSRMLVGDGKAEPLIGRRP